MLLLVKFFAITVAWTLVDTYKQRDKLFFLHKSSGENNETLLVVTWSENDDEINAGCEFFTDKELINEVLRSSNDSPIRTLSEDEMENLLEDCTEFTLRRRRRDASEDEEREAISSIDLNDDPAELGNGQGNNGRRRQNNPNRQGNNTNRQGNNTNRQGNNTSRQGNNSNRQENNTNRQGNNTNRQGNNTNKQGNNTDRQGNNTDRQGNNTGRQGNNTNRQGNNTNRQGNNTNRQGNSTSGQGNNPRSGQNNAGNGQTDRRTRKISTTRASPNDIEEETTTIIQNADATTPGYDGLPVIFPGTKWCGAGDRAKNYDDLGLHQDTDRCCRAHDFCNDTLAPGETRNNLTNTSPFTKLSCQCDHQFFDCLDRVNSITSNTIGNMYFNILRRECYELDYPLTKKCKKYRTILRIKCIEYERNTKAPKENQWVSARKYKKIPFPGPLTVTLPF